MCTAHEPPTAASVATAANVSAIPANKGRPLLRKGWSARAKKKGSTGRMHGLRMVSMPPRNTRATSVISAFRPRQAPYHDAKHTVVDRVGSDLITTRRTSVGGGAPHQPWRPARGHRIAR